MASNVVFERRRGEAKTSWWKKVWEAMKKMLDAHNAMCKSSTGDYKNSLKSMKKNAKKASSAKLNAKSSKNIKNG